ncbi:hypothetical protein SteCoe_16801 [Stentor coeruleus]|uniref:Uncharacterized protein n=1 Tax=Stentor coeruleus TaxID=5963 RepID=A0A1R2C0H2_9CILI|nr:hypothetical protein SteCoe_16801 [Stentor coeruleus]
MDNNPDPLQQLQNLDPNEWPNIPKPLLGAVVCMKKCILSQSAKLNELNQKVNINSGNTQRKFEETEFKINQTHTFATALEETLKKQLKDTSDGLYSEISTFQSMMTKDFDFKQKSADTRLNIMQEQQFAMKRALQILPGAQEIERNIKDANAELRTNLKKEIFEYIVYPEVVTLNNKIMNSNENFEKYISKLQELVEVLRSNMQVMEAQQTERQQSFERLLRNVESEKREDLDGVQQSIKNVSNDLKTIEQYFSEKHKTILSFLTNVEKSSKEVISKSKGQEEKARELQEKTYDLEERSNEIEDRARDLEERAREMEDRINFLEDSLQRYGETQQEIQHIGEMEAEMLKEQKEKKKRKKEKKAKKNAENEEKIQELNNVYEPQESKVIKKSEQMEHLKLSLPLNPILNTLEDLPMSPDSFPSMVQDLTSLSPQVSSKFQEFPNPISNFIINPKEAFTKPSNLINEIEKSSEFPKTTRETVKMSRDSSFKRKDSSNILKESSKPSKESQILPRESPKLLRESPDAPKESPRTREYGRNRRDQNSEKKNIEEYGENDIGKRISPFISPRDRSLSNSPTKMMSDENLKKYSLKISSLEDKTKELENNLIVMQNKHKSEKLDLELMIKDLKDKLMWLPMNLNVIKGKTPTEARLYTIEARLRTEENNRADQYNLLLAAVNKIKLDITNMASSNNLAFPNISSGRYTARVLDRKPSIEMGDSMKGDQRYSDYQPRPEREKSRARKMSVDMDRNFRGQYFIKRGTLNDSIGF